MPSLKPASEMMEQFNSISSQVPDVEILYVDNSESNEDCSHPSVTHLNKGKKNIFVNPSWNLGASKAKFDILLIFQDDIDINWCVVPDALKYVIPETGMVGPHTYHTMISNDTGKFRSPQPPSKITASWAQDRMAGYGMAFFIHKDSYVPIPDDLKIMWGDEWLFRKNPKKNLLLDQLEVLGDVGKSSSNFNEVSERDSFLFKTQSRFPHSCMKDLTFLVGTCDTYQFLWDNFKTLVNRYLDLGDAKRMAFSESVEFGDGYKTIFADDGPEGKVWSNRLIKALDEVETEFVFFVLDDYYFTREIGEADFKRMMAVLHADSFDKFMFVKELKSYSLAATTTMNDPMDNFGTLFIQAPDSPYLTSIQPAIWRTDWLRECAVSNWTPWEFELKGTDRIKGRHNRVYLYHTSPNFYFNAIRSNDHAPITSEGWEEVKEKENLSEIILPT